MRKGLLVLGFLLVITGAAEASIGQSLGHAWAFITTPVNCAAALVSDLVGAGVKFVVCVLGNLNPSNLIP